MALQRVRDEQKAREDALEREKRMHSSVLRKFHSQESSLESKEMEYISKMATAQREVADMSRALQRAEAVRNWLRADKESLQDLLNAAKTRLEVEKKQVMLQEATFLGQVRDLNERVEQLLQQVSTEQGLRAAAEEHVRDLQERAQHDDNGPARRRVSDLEQRLKVMAGHLLTKQEEMGKLAMAKEELTLRLAAARPTAPRARRGVVWQLTRAPMGSPGYCDRCSILKNSVV